jgi:dihydroorotase-like cyclic amidohydrolase
VSDDNLKTKCGWSPYAGYRLTGAPMYTILKGQCYNLRDF